MPREFNNPAFNISAIASRMPDPQMPTGGCCPMVCTCRSPSADLHALDRAGGRAHPGADVCAFKGRAGRARTAHQLPFMRHGDFRVGADVQRHDGFVGLPDVGGEQHRHMISADKTGNIRRQIDRRAGGDLQPEVAGAHFQRVADGRDDTATCPVGAPASPQTSDASPCCPR